MLAGPLAAEAQARLVYVTNAETAAPMVHTARDNGKERQRVGIGRAPTVSPDSRWIAYITVPRTQHGQGGGRAASRSAAARAASSCAPAP